MKTIGLIGGMSWESSREYYRILNETYRDRVGGSHSCPIILYSLDFKEIEKLQHEGDWKALEQLMFDAASKLFVAGADILVICANTMHKVSHSIERSFKKKFIHIADATASFIVQYGIKKVGLLGTSFTMKEDFYKDRLKKGYGIEVIIPEPNEMNEIHKIIYEQLIKGETRTDSKIFFREVAKKLESKGAKGIILGCTEIPMLMKEDDSPLPLFDTTYIHSLAALNAAMK